MCLTALPHEWVASETQDDVMSILAWSFAALAQGCFPNSRHDDQPWTGRGFPQNEKDFRNRAARVVHFRFMRKPTSEGAVFPLMGLVALDSSGPP